MTFFEFVMGNYKWYRKWKGGYWSKVVGFPYYWINRKPYEIEIGAGHLLDTEDYT